MYLKLFSFAVISLLVSHTLAAEWAIPENKKVIEFETKIGIVTFEHEQHASLNTTQCTTCHHKNEPADAAIKPCHECHQHESTQPQKAKLAFHARCTGCHEYTITGGQNAGPLKKKCKLCHVK